MVCGPECRYSTGRRERVGLVASVAEGFAATDRAACFGAARSVYELEVEKCAEAGRSLTAGLGGGSVTGCAPTGECARSFVEKVGGEGEGAWLLLESAPVAEEAAEEAAPAAEEATAAEEAATAE